MISIIRKAGYIILPVLLIIVNIIIFTKARDFSEIYPFHRVITGGTLTYEIDFTDSVFPHGALITKIEEEDINGRNSLITALKKYKKNSALTVTYKLDDNVKSIKIIKQKINNHYLFFLLFFIMYANIHYLWGILLIYRRPYEFRTRMYFYCSIQLSFFYFSLVEHFTYAGFQVFHMLIIMIGSFMMIVTGYSLITEKIGLKALIPVIITAVIVIGSGLKSLSSGDIFPYTGIMLFLLLCSGLTGFKLLRVIGKKGYSFESARNILLLTGLAVGLLIPLLSFLVFYHKGFDLSLCLISALTFIFPIFLGNYYIKYNQYDSYGFNLFQKKHILMFLANSIVAILSSLLLYSITYTEQGIKSIVFTIIIGIIIFILLFALRFLGRQLNRIKFEDKVYYAGSLQNIAELVSFHNDLSLKIENIFSEIISLTEASSLKLVLFNDIFDESNAKIGKYIEKQPPESDLGQFLEKNRWIILKYSLIKASKKEERIYRFLEERDLVLIVPVFEDKEVKCALLIGEKSRGGLYSSDDVYYFDTVAHQLYQLIENDNLYKDYIIKRHYEKELDNASYVQLRLFPKIPPERDRGLDISFFYRPYLRVIGDYFDFFNVDENNTAIVIGDVSGHGLSAAMILSAVNSITYTMFKEKRSFEETFDEINYFLTKSYKGIELITLFVGIFNKSTREIAFINAGHSAPIHVKKDKKELRFIEERCKILGADPQAVYSSSKFTLEKNDELILYTDGVIEIYDEATGEELNEDSLVEIIRDNFEKSIDGKIIEIEKSIRFHSKAIKDDITLLGVKIH